MSLSRVFKEIEIKSLGASPLVMQDLGRPGANGAAISGSSVVGGQDHERLAYEQGFAAGEKAGFELGRKKAEALFGPLAGLIEELGSARSAVLQASEKDVVDLALAIARKVVRSEISARGDVISGCVRLALGAANARGQVTVRLNPRDLELVSGLVKSESPGQNLTFVSDETISRGGCIVLTDFGTVDATIESVTEDIEERLKGAY